MDSFETDSIEIATDVALGLCSEVERLSQQLQDARAENVRLREALGWYVGRSAESLMFNGSRRAIEALSEATE